MSKLPVSSDDHALRYARLAGLPQSASVNNCLSVGASTSNSTVEDEGRISRRSTTPMELDACSRSNIVTARTRFFEEKSRSGSPATPPQRRSRSATRIDDRQPLWNASRDGCPSIPAAVRHLPVSGAVQAASVKAVHRHGQAAPVSMLESSPLVNKVVVNNETDELKV